MKNQRPAHPGIRRMQVLLGLLLASLLAVLPVVHHHPAPTQAGSPSQIENSCTLCAVFTGMGTHGAEPPLVAPQITSTPVSPTGSVVLRTPSGAQTGSRAPPVFQS